MLARVAEVLRRPAVFPLVVVLTIGLVLRIAMWIAMPAPLFAFPDANVYVAAAQEYLFRGAEGRTAGYPLFLRTLHGIWASPILPVVVQQLCSLLGTAVLYLLALRVGVQRWWAAAAVATWAISIDWLWLEHQLLTETVASLLVVLALAVPVLWPAAKARGWAMVVAAGVVTAALGMAGGLTRPAYLLAMPGIGLALVLLLPTTWPRRLVAGVACVLASVALLGGYLKVQEIKTGYDGPVNGVGHDFGEYPFAAMIADCTRFVVPKGTETLCERLAPRKRASREYYYWAPNSPGRRLLRRHPERTAAIKLWVHRVYDTHRGEVRREMTNAFQRTFGLGGYERPNGDQGTAVVGMRAAADQPIDVVLEAVERYYGPGAAPTPEPRFPYGVLAAVQPWIRPHGILLLLALMASIAGAALGRGRGRAAALAFAVTGWLPIFFATYTASQYNFRYLLPAMPLILVAGMAGFWALRARWAGRPDPPPSDAAGPEDDADDDAESAAAQTA